MSNIEGIPETKKYSFNFFFEKMQDPDSPLLNHEPVSK